MTEPEKPYGYDLVISVWTPGVGPEEKKFHKQGSESKVRRWARLKPGYQDIVKLDPYNKEQWHRVYGHRPPRV